MFLITTTNASIWFAVLFTLADVLTSAPQVATRAPQAPAAERWIASQTVSDVGANLQVVGAADAATTAEALTNSLESAIYRTATELVRRQVETSRAPLTISFDTLRGYIRRVGKVEATYTQPTARGYRGYTRLTVSRGLLDPVTIRNLAVPSVKPSDQVAIGFLLMPADVNDLSSSSYRVQALCSKPSDGNFSLVFAIQREAGTRIRLERIDVIDDGSSGGTKWSFEISVNGRPAIRIPAATYDDRVGRYRMRAGDPQFEFSLSDAGPNLELQAVGRRQ